MKNITNFLAYGMMLFAFGFIGATATFAQATPELCDPIYQKFLDNRKGPDIPKYEVAIASGKEFLEKCKGLEGGEQVYDYVTKQVPRLQDTVDKKRYQDEVVTPFDENVRKKDFDKVFELGKKIVAREPDFVDVMLVLASIGYDKAAEAPPVDKFNNDTIMMARAAIQKLEEGKPSVTGDFGAFAYVYKTPACADGKTNAIGWMNFTVGSITYYRQKNLQASLPYLYKATQNGCETKLFPDIYRMIGAWYLEEAIKINTKRLEAIKAAGDQDTDETKAMLAMQKGYADRSIDAYARAYKLTGDPKVKVSAEFKNALYAKMTDLYKFRYDGKTEGIDAYVANVSSKPFPDPTSAVTPVAEEPETPATTTAPVQAMMPTSSESPAANADTRPRTAPVPAVAAPVATTTAAAKTTTTAKKTTTVTKKAKKKVTR